MSFASFAPVTRQQIDTAVRTFKSGRSELYNISVRQPHNIPSNSVQIEMEGRAEVEEFMLRLAMITSGDALAGEVTNMPTVVDTEDILLRMAIFRIALDEVEEDRFVLELKLSD